MNDGGCDPQGRFYCANMAYDETPGRGHRCTGSTRTARSSVVLTGATISNGMVWSLDGTQVYYIDTPTGRVDVFDFDADGAARCVEPAAGRARSIRPSGIPDGMTIDAEGGLWVALWDGSAVHRYDADGALTEVIEVPATPDDRLRVRRPEPRRALHHHVAARHRPGRASRWPARCSSANPGVRGRACPDVWRLNTAGTCN